MSILQSSLLYSSGVTGKARVGDIICSPFGLVWLDNVFVCSCAADLVQCMYASALAVHVTFMGVKITAKVVVVSREESHRHVLINLHIIDVNKNKTD